MDGCIATLRPTDWIQTVARYKNVSVGGRRLAVQCKPEHDRKMALSDGSKLHDHGVHLQVFDTKIEIGEKPLERGIGVLSFHPARDARDDIEGHGPILTGWLTIPPDDCAELWAQVRTGGYAECRIVLNMGPVGFKGMQWVWDVERQQHLFIDSVSIEFTRKAVIEAKEEPQPRKGLFSWR